MILFELGIDILLLRILMVLCHLNMIP